ncbi:hypothetical protein [Mesorhizobium huakuii]|uniref:Cytochrome c domain-containing protein n=1 Tax=Mesorhizobium huakuii TaxID=28104 RepID=A0A7G6T4D4_9HYPH|nr:hypothetical protein [Mesorhizobium huakuii]QND61616.1 hypothetical protein HB778_35620 [Mesorhizobium huakuii]
MRIFVATILALAVGSTAVGAAGTSEGTMPNYCQTTPIRGDAFDRPSKHAWDLFVSLNHPAIDRKIARGTPDCFKPFGAPGATSVWETWRNAQSEVYTKNGAEPPFWNDVTTLKDEAPGKVPLPKSGKSGGPGPFFSPSDGIFHNAGGFGETRMNRATYEFIRDECLFSVEGQQRYAKAVDEGKKPPIQFPADSIEVKAAWIDFDDPQGDKSAPPIPEAQRGTYYTAEFEGKVYGLIALHIITKDIANWFWASFHHKDQPDDGIKFTSPDDYGVPRIAQGTVWENYRLGGTQVDFTLPTGSATILGDHNIEYKFVRSSCIACHATAAISREIWTSETGRKFVSMPSAQQKAVCSISPEDGGGVEVCKEVIGKEAFRPDTDKLVLERGIPDPTWFQRDGEPFFHQTDFVWSIPFRGRSESAPPPDRCIR